MGFWTLIVLYILLCTFIIYKLFSLFTIWLYCKHKQKFDENRIKKIYEQNCSSYNENTTPSKKTTIKQTIDKFLYGYVRYRCIKTGRIPSFKMRNWSYRHIYKMKITKRTVINGGCEFRSPWNILADKVIIGNNCIIDARNGIVFEDNVVLGNGIHIWTEEHNVNDSLFRVLTSNKLPVIIHSRAWLCSDSTILPGCEIGEGAIVASKAVVTKNIESFSINAGIPAKKIKDRNTDLKYELSGKPTWYFY